jgi:membrane fusion protein (multidrug efflux system)
VTSLTPTTVPLARELPGRVSAFRVAEVRARVDGIILKRLFTEGADVKEGQPLYQIDPAPYDAALESARATLAKAEANVASARLQAQRYKELVAANAVSRQEYDNAVANLGAFDADISVAKAAIKTAAINLGYTNVTSPVSGRIGRSSVTEGAYVQQGQATLLATVQQLDPVYVDLTQSSTELLKLKGELASGKLKNDGVNAKVTALLDGKAYGESGQLQFSDVTVDPSTGSVVLRALFPNPAGDLLPGMFVRARVELGAITGAILVPQVAVTRNSQGNAVAYVVGKDNKIEPRILTAERTMGDRWLVSAGVVSGDRVVVDGLQRLRPGLEVKPVPTDEATPTAVR